MAVPEKRSRVETADEAHRPVFLCCDIQERFRGLVFGGEALIHTAEFLLRVAALLECPVLATGAEGEAQVIEGQGCV